jgi:single-strand DNA-binding protein
MPPPSPAASDADDKAGLLYPARNEVFLWGRVAAEPAERELPSGDAIVTARIVVDRGGAARTRSKQRVDTIDCVSWSGRAQRSMRRWSAGDYVEIEGAIRRRFYRGVAGPVSRVEVEVLSCRKAKPKRADSG